MTTRLLSSSAIPIAVPLRREAVRAAPRRMHAVGAGLLAAVCAVAIAFAVLRLETLPSATMWTPWRCVPLLDPRIVGLALTSLALLGTGCAGIVASALTLQRRRPWPALLVGVVVPVVLFAVFALFVWLPSVCIGCCTIQ